MMRSSSSLCFALVCLLCMCLVTPAVAFQFELVVGLPHTNPDLLHARFVQISDPLDERYLQHMSVAQIADIVGASSADLDITTAWLRDTMGARPDSVRVNALRDTVTATFDSDPTGHPLWTARGLPHAAGHPLPFDFVLRRDSVSVVVKTTPRAVAKKLGADINTLKQV